MHKYIILSLIIISPYFGLSQILTWDKIYNKENVDRAWSIKQTIDGGYIVVSTSGIYDTTDIWILKLNKSGDTLWTKIHDGTASDGAYSIIQDDDGGYVISGYTCETFFYWEFVILALKIDEFGNYIWSYKSDVGNQVGRDITKTFDGGYAILGINYAMFLEEIIIIKLNNNGEKEWIKTYYYPHPSSPNVMYEINQTQDSGFILAGTTMTQSGFSDIWVMKLNKEGDSTWSKTIDYEGMDEGYSIKQMDDGNYILSAKSGNDIYGHNTLLIYKLDEDGNETLLNSFNGNSSYHPYFINLTSDNGYILAGKIYQQLGYHGIYIIKLDNSGDSLWSRVYEHENYAYSSSIEIYQTTDNGYIVCGNASNPYGLNKSDIWILKLDKSGLVQIDETQYTDTIICSKVYPNPISSTAKIDIYSSVLNVDDLVFKLFDLNGRLLRKEKIVVNEFSEKKTVFLDVKELENGIYLYSIEYNRGHIANKFIVSK